MKAVKLGDTRNWEPEAKDRINEFILEKYNKLGDGRASEYFNTNPEFRKLLKTARKGKLYANDVITFIQMNNKKLVDVLKSNAPKNNIYDLHLSDNLLVKAKFPRVIENIEEREWAIRNAMQILFEYVYGIKNSVAMIMAHMNIKDETIEEFCEKYGLLSYLPEARKLYSEISAKVIEFDLSNVRASVKIDGKYHRETKFTNGSHPEYISPENTTNEKIEIDQTDKNVVIKRMNHLISIFEEELVAAKGLYNFELEIEQSDISLILLRNRTKGYKPNSTINPYYKAFIIGEDQVDDIERPKKVWEKIPVFEVKLEEYKKKYSVGYRSEYCGYNSTDLWLYNDIQIRDHIRKGLLLAIHYFTTNDVKKI